jgi:hypothetical protein
MLYLIAFLWIASRFIKKERDDEKWLLRYAIAFLTAFPARGYIKSDWPSAMSWIGDGLVYGVLPILT